MSLSKFSENRFLKVRILENHCFNSGKPHDEKLDIARGFSKMGMLISSAQHWSSVIQCRCRYEAMPRLSLNLRGSMLKICEPSFTTITCFMGRRARAIKQAQQIVVKIGDTTVVFPLDRELLTSRGHAMDTAKRLRPLAVDYLRRLEIPSFGLLMDDDPLSEFEPLSTPSSGDAPWAQSAWDDLPRGTSKFAEQDMNCHTDCAPQIHSPHAEDSVERE
jgi:hypothetical protein